MMHHNAVGKPTGHGQGRSLLHKRPQSAEHHGFRCDLGRSAGQNKVICDYRDVEASKWFREAELPAQIIFNRVYDWRSAEQHHKAHEIDLHVMFARTFDSCHWQNEQKNLDANLCGRLSDRCVGLIRVASHSSCNSGHFNQEAAAKPCIVMSASQVRPCCWQVVCWCRSKPKTDKAA